MTYTEAGASHTVDLALTVAALGAAPAPAATDESSASLPGLAGTGWDAVQAVAVAALLLLLGGMAVTLTARRRQARRVDA